MLRKIKLLHILHTKVLSMCSLVALHIQQGIAIIDEVSSLRTVGHVLSLTMTGDEEAMSCRH